MRALVGVFLLLPGAVAEYICSVGRDLASGTDWADGDEFRAIRDRSRAGK